MPEGDTLYRTAAVLRDVLLGRPVVAARGRAGGPALARLQGSTVTGVETRGKHLLVTTDAGLTLHTHLGMRGSWHRYRVGEAWHRAPERAVAVLQVAGAVAVCFDAPTVELLDSRAVAIHRVLRALGPDLLAADDDAAASLSRLRDPSRAGMAVGDALLDQRAVAGLGNVYRSEVCFLERVHPMAPVAVVPDQALERLVATGRRLLAATRGGAARSTRPGALGRPAGTGVARPRGDRLWVYGRTGRPCRRCGSLIASGLSGPLARRAYWCPTCQPAAPGRGEASAATPPRVVPG